MRFLGSAVLWFVLFTSLVSGLLLDELWTQGYVDSCKFMPPSLAGRCSLERLKGLIRFTLGKTEPTLANKDDKGP